MTRVIDDEFNPTPEQAEYLSERASGAEAAERRLRRRLRVHPGRLALLHADQRPQLHARAQGQIEPRGAPRRPVREPHHGVQRGPGCGSTKAEANVNSPAWYDTTDISLVDGFNEQVMMTVTDSTGEKKLGPVISAEGNEDNFGVFPLGCDGCSLRIDPPCGQSAGGPGCHGGTQYDPKPVCQYQSGAKGGSSAVVVMLIDAVPAKP